MSEAYNPTIEQSLYQSWENNFILLAQNKRSVLSTSKAVKDFSFQGNRHNFGRMGKVGLSELSGRNPTVSWQEWAVDNRQALKRTFAIPIILDTKDLREAMADPTSDIYVNIVNAFNRRKDKLIAEASLAPVMVGDPNSGTPLTSLTATQDGVISTDATSGLTYDAIKGGIENMINLSTAYGDIANSNVTFVGGGTDWGQLLDDDKFINNRYVQFQPVKEGYVNKLFGVDFFTLPGNKTGATYNINDAILAEDTTNGIRSCLLMAENSIAFSLVKMEFRYTKNLQGYYRSDGLQFYCEMSALRLEGARIQEVRTSY